MKCYIALGYKKNAKSCLKQLKRYRDRCPTNPYRKISVYETLISNMSEKKSPSNEIPAARTIEKCSYFACEKKEKYPREFLYCSKCRSARYCCVKHQTKDWKNGHKKRCILIAKEKK